MILVVCSIYPKIFDENVVLVSIFESPANFKKARNLKTLKNDLQAAGGSLIH